MVIVRIAQTFIKSNTLPFGTFKLIKSSIGPVDGFERVPGCSGP